MEISVEIVVATIGAIIGLDVDILSMAAAIAVIVVAATVVDVSMTSRPPESPTRTEVPARQCAFGDALASSRR